MVEVIRRQWGVLPIPENSHSRDFTHFLQLYEAGWKHLQQRTHLGFDKFHHSSDDEEESLHVLGKTWLLKTLIWVDLQVWASICWGWSRGVGGRANVLTSDRGWWGARAEWPYNVKLLLLRTISADASAMVAIPQQLMRIATRRQRGGGSATEGGAYPSRSPTSKPLSPRDNKTSTHHTKKCKLQDYLF